MQINQLCIDMFKIRERVNCEVEISLKFSDQPFEHLCVRITKSNGLTIQGKKLTMTRPFVELASCNEFVGVFKNAIAKLED